MGEKDDCNARREPELLIGEAASHELDTESPDGYDGIDFTRCHSRDRLRSTTATLDSSACQFLPLLSMMVKHQTTQGSPPECTVVAGAA